MDAEDIAKYAITGLVLFIVASTVVSIFLTIISFVLTVVFTLAIIGVVAMATFGLLSVLTEVGKQVIEESEGQSTTEMSQEKRVERLKQKYLNGDITEEEFERRLGLELGGPDEEFVAGKSVEREFNRKF